MLGKFKKLTVVFRRKDGVLSAHVVQGGQLGTNLLPKNQLSSTDSAKKVIGYLLERLTDEIVFMEELDGAPGLLAQAGHHNAQQA